METIVEELSADMLEEVDFSYKENLTFPLVLLSYQYLLHMLPLLKCGQTRLKV